MAKKEKKELPPKVGPRLDKWHDADVDDPRYVYKDRQCYMNFNSVNYHDYSCLSEFNSLSEFLNLYKDSVFLGDGTDLYVEEKNDVCETLQNICMNCLLSRSKSSTCEYEEELPKRRVITLFIDSKKIVCPDCNTRFYGYPKEISKPSVADVRLCGRPTLLVMERENLKCPKCRRRIPVKAVPVVQLETGDSLSIRLLSALASERIRKVPTNLSAQGYGISDRTIRKYKQKIIKIIEEEINKQDAKRIRSENCVKAMELTSSKRDIFIEKAAILSDTSYTFSFSYDPLSLSSEQSTVLRAAFDQRTVSVFSRWLEGEFYIQMSRTLSDTELTRLAYYYTATKYPDVPHPLSYLTAELVIACVKAIQRRQHPVDISSFEWLAAIMQVGKGDLSLIPDGYDCTTYISTLNSVFYQAHSLWSRKIARAIRKLLNYVNYARTEISVMIESKQKPLKSEHPQIVLSKINETVQILESATNQPEFDSQSALADILYLNPAVIPLLIEEDGTAEFPITQDGLLDTQYLSPTGIPLHCLNHLLKQGLFDKDRNGAISCSLQRYQSYQNQPNHPCEGHLCPWIFKN